MKKKILLSLLFVLALGFAFTVSAATYNFGTTTLKNGSRGEAVMELQRFLNANLNLGLIIDGKLGPKTIAVIREWQKDNGLVADGLIGAKTKLMMNSIGSSSTNQIIPVVVTPTPSPTPTSTIVWDTYTGNGVTFQYPDSSNLSPYVTFQKPTVVVAPQGSTSIDSNGCFISYGSDPKDTVSTINGMNFCWSGADDSGMSRIHRDYYYTTLENGNYYTIEYPVDASECINLNEAYTSTPCYTDFQMVPSILQQSVSTLTFTSTTGCQTLYWTDNNNQSCVTTKQFCGMYMYQGLHTFTTQAQCQATLSIPAQLTLIVPTTGEQDLVGNPMSINWTGGNPGDQYLIGLSDPNGGILNLTNGGISESVGAYTWNVPTAITPGDYKIALFKSPSSSSFNVFSDSNRLTNWVSFQLVSQSTPTTSETLYVNFDVTAQNPSGGTVISSPFGINCTGTYNPTSGGISKSGTCSATFPSGTQVTLSATPVAGSVLSNFDEGCHGASSSSIYPFVMNASRSSCLSFSTSTSTSNISVTESPYTCVVNNAPMVNSPSTMTCSIPYSVTNTGNSIVYVPGVGNTGSTPSTIAVNFVAQNPSGTISTNGGANLNSVATIVQNGTIAMNTGAMSGGDGLNWSIPPTETASFIGKFTLTDPTSANPGQYRAFLNSIPWGTTPYTSNWNQSYTSGLGSSNSSVPAYSFLN